jgi:CheY-like chemotaxis protein
MMGGASDGARGSAAILLVEDTDLVRAVTICMLRSLGYSNVTTAVNGEEAVKACTGASFDLILMDCEMPVLNGFDATRRIRAAGVRTPVVAYTASLTTSSRSRCAEAGMDDFLEKPAQPGQLAMKLHLWLRSARG